MSKGIDQLNGEMARQHGDALDSLVLAQDRAGEIAQAVRQRGRLLLLGMGGSHWINRAACPSYVAAGVDATCHVISEYMRAPLAADAAMLLTSQSGRSGEVLRFLDMGLASDACFGLTLDGDSPMVRRLPCVVGAGGPEVAYAATRSLLVTLAQHSAILAPLGQDIAPVEVALGNPVQADPMQIQAAVSRLSKCKNAVMVARGTSRASWMQPHFA